MLHHLNSNNKTSACLGQFCTAFVTEIVGGHCSYCTSSFLPCLNFAVSQAVRCYFTHWGTEGSIERFSGMPSAFPCPHQWEPFATLEDETSCQKQEQHPCLKSQSNLTKVNQCQSAGTKYNLEPFMVWKIYQSPIGRSFQENKNLHFTSEHLAAGCVLSQVFPGSVACRCDLKGAHPQRVLASHWKSPRHVGASPWILLGGATPSQFLALWRQQCSAQCLFAVSLFAPLALAAAEEPCVLASAGQTFPWQCLHCAHPAVCQALPLSAVCKSCC